MSLSLDSPLQRRAWEILSAIPVIFLGGGAALLKTHVPRTDKIFRPIILDDITMNAKAYELLAGKAAGRRQGV